MIRPRCGRRRGFVVHVSRSEAGVVDHNLEHNALRRAIVVNVMLEAVIEPRVGEGGQVYCDYINYTLQRF